MAEMEVFERRVADTLAWCAADVSLAVDAVAVAHRVALEHPRRRARALPWGPVAVSRLAWALLLAGLLLALVVGSLMVGARRPDHAVVVAPSPTPLAACPPGSTPDEPGAVDEARPPASEYVGPMVWNGAAGRMVLLATETWADFVRRRDLTSTSVMPGRVTWTLDVCTNRWHQGRVSTALPDSGAGPGTLVYDEDSDATLLIADDLFVWSYDLGADTWTRRGGATPRWITQAVYDPVSGLVLGRGGTNDEMWTYDVDADTWREVDQGDMVPPRQGNSGFEFMSFDRSADRLVLYRDSGTWLFDPRVRTWAKVSTSVPIWFFIGGDGMIYDEGSERTIIYGQGSVAAFDAGTSTWELLYGTGTWGQGGDSRFDRGAGWAIAYDPLNERVVVVGGTVWSAELNGWQPVDDVVAFDPLTRSWIELLAPGP